MSSLLEIRKRLGLSQGRMADLLDLSLRAYQDMEGGNSKTRARDLKAAEYFSLEHAVAEGNINLASPETRRLALELARLITG